MEALAQVGQHVWTINNSHHGEITETYVVSGVRWLIVVKTDTPWHVQATQMENSDFWQIRDRGPEEESRN